MFTYYCRLVDQGYGVVGVELAEAAAKQFFEEHNIKCTQHKVNDDVIIYEVIWQMYIRVTSYAITLGCWC